MSCPKNPRKGGHHELPHAMPWTPEWFKLTEQQKIETQFCKWCGKAIW